MRVHVLPPIVYQIPGFELLHDALRRRGSFTVDDIHFSYDTVTISADIDVGEKTSVGLTYSDVGQTSAGPVHDSRLSGRITIHF